MADETVIKNNPPTLYKTCLSAFVSNLNYNVKTLDQVCYLRLLPPNILADIYVKMSRFDHLKDMLHVQLTDLDIFSRLLRINSTRQKLFRCVSSLMYSGKLLAAQLQFKYAMKYGLNPANDSEKISSKSAMKQQKQEQIFIDDFDLDAIDFGLRLGSFLSEAGWLNESTFVLTCVSSKLETLEQDFQTLLLRLDCLQRLLHSEAVLCSFKSCELIYHKILDIIDKTGVENIPSNLLATCYAQLSLLFFSRSEYNQSLQFSILALKQLKPTTPERIVIDVLRQSAKSCVIKREFKRASMLITQALRRARITFGRHHQKYADALLDYGFFLLNIDTFSQSVAAYKEALDIKRHIFGHRNFHVAIAHEDLAYAYYVHEYSSGDFQSPLEHIEKAIDIMKSLVPSNHIMLASAKRVKALLLEEIALENMQVQNGNDEEGLLLQSEELHKIALQLSLDAFGEYNVQTAKHYGNLGRLYQTMNRFEEAEKMHKKAIKIKTDLLGPFDYEVGLSIGHLASLYNYHMKKYREAEQLYLRSIEVNIRLFGKAYSGLEYDYMGLIHIYEILNDIEKYLEYADILDNWRTLRGGGNLIINKTVYPDLCEDLKSLEEVTEQFFQMSPNDPNAQPSIPQLKTTLSPDILM